VLGLVRERGVHVVLVRELIADVALRVEEDVIDRWALRARRPVLRVEQDEGPPASTDGGVNAEVVGLP
jgi:hypothetical protein